MFPSLTGAVRKLEMTRGLLLEFSALAGESRFLLVGY